MIGLSILILRNDQEERSGTAASRRTSGIWTKPGDDGTPRSSPAAKSCEAEGRATEQGKSALGFKSRRVPHAIAGERFTRGVNVLHFLASSITIELYPYVTIQWDLS